MYSDNVFIEYKRLYTFYLKLIFSEIGFIYFSEGCYNCKTHRKFILLTQNSPGAGFIGDPMKRWLAFLSFWTCSVPTFGEWLRLHQKDKQHYVPYERQQSPDHEHGLH